jgi:hypothetical protein
MEQEALSRRKGHAEEHIEMAKIGLQATESNALQDPVRLQAQHEGPNLRTKKQRITENIQFAALCWCFFLVGWNDGSTGPLLPRIQDFYHVHHV